MNMQTSLIKDYTKGNIKEQLIKMSIPFMISNLLQMMYSVVDMLIVGQLVSSAALAAVSIAGQVTTLLSTVCIGFALGGQILISQIIGMNDKTRLNKMIGTLFITMLFIAIFVSIATFLFARPILQLINTHDDIICDATSYIVVCGLGTLFSFGYLTVSAVLRGIGDAKKPLVIMVISSCLNIVLDYLFIGFFGMGVSGAATATILSQGIAFIGCIFYLYKKKEALGFDFKLKSFIPDKFLMKKFIKLGIPYALQSSTINLSMLAVNGLVNSYGVIATATFGVGNKIQHIPDIIGRSLSMAGSTIIAQNIGARNLQRAKTVVNLTLIINTLVFVLFTFIFLLYPQQIFSLFAQDNSLESLGEMYIYMMLIGFPAYILLVPCNSFVKGIGNANLTFALSIFDGIVLRIFLSWFMAEQLGMGLQGLFLGYHLAAYGTAIPAAIYFFSGLWKKKFSKALE